MNALIFQLLLTPVYYTRINRIIAASTFESYERSIKQKSKIDANGVKEVISTTVQSNASSIIMCILIEMSIFLIGVISEMPAVKIFAFNAAMGRVKYITSNFPLLRK